MRVRIPPSAPTLDPGSLSMVMCSRCGQSAPPLQKPPFGGSLGENIHKNVCSDCWSIWLGEQTKFINEHQLRLSDPASRQLLDQQLRAFLKLESGGRI